MHWIYTQYDLPKYNQNHSNLLKNVFDFLLPKEEVAINIDLQGERTASSAIDLSIYLKNQTTDSPITSSDYSSLNVLIK